MDEKEFQMKTKKKSKMKNLNQEIKSPPEIIIRPEKSIKEKPVERDKDYFEKEGITWR